MQLPNNRVIHIKWFKRDPKCNVLYFVSVIKYGTRNVLKYKVKCRLTLIQVHNCLWKNAAAADLLATTL